jgi:hypothetical protein
MRWRDAGRPPDGEALDLEVTGDAHQPSDEGTGAVERGTKRLRPHAGVAGLVLPVIVAAVIVAAAGGYVAGSHRTGAADHAAAPGGPSPAGTAVPAGAEPIAATGKRCSAQYGDRLQFGVEIVNRSATAATLHQVQAVLPLAGLRPTASAWSACGQLSPTPTGRDYPLPAGATAWLAITFDVLVPCPDPLPVLFTLSYTQAARPGVADLPGFPDLGDVPYASTRCPAGSG